MPGAGGGKCFHCVSADEANNVQCPGTRSASQERGLILTLANISEFEEKLTKPFNQAKLNLNLVNWEMVNGNLLFAVKCGCRKMTAIQVCKNHEDWQQAACGVTLCGDYFSFFLRVTARPLYYLDTQSTQLPEPR